jgi:hypothetical protein
MSTIFFRQMYSIVKIRLHKAWEIKFSPAESKVLDEKIIRALSCGELQSALELLLLRDGLKEHINI